MAVTLREIAQATGLSVPTVGNVLGSGAHRHSAATRAVVLKAARELGYTPNASARAIRYGRFGCIALIMSRSKARTHSFLPIGMLDGIEDELSKHDMHLSVARLGDAEFQSTGLVPKVLRQSTSDGLIVHYTHELPPAIKEIIGQHHAPVVGTNAKLDANCVYLDDYGAARSATLELVRRGHRRIVLLQIQPVLGPTSETLEQRMRNGHYSIADRRAGYLQAMKEAGLTARIVPDDSLVPYTEFAQVTDALMSGDAPPTAVLCYQERETTPLVHSILKRGLSIPNDVSVAFFGADDQWTLGVLISAVKLPVDEMGREAVRMVLEKVANPNAECPAKALAYGLAKSSQSVAKVRRS
jgi:LacI family transcriptional regulator